jgi:hypothetical protein
MSESTGTDPSTDRIWTVPNLARPERVRRLRLAGWPA